MNIDNVFIVLGRPHNFVGLTHDVEFGGSKNYSKIQDSRFLGFGFLTTNHSWSQDHGKIFCQWRKFERGSCDRNDKDRTCMKMMTSGKQWRLTSSSWNKECKLIKSSLNFSWPWEFYNIASQCPSYYWASQRIFTF